MQSEINNFRTHQYYNERRDGLLLSIPNYLLMDQFESSQEFQDLLNNKNNIEAQYRVCEKIRLDYQSINRYAMVVNPYIPEQAMEVVRGILKREYDISLAASPYIYLYEAMTSNPNKLLSTMGGRLTPHHTVTKELVKEAVLNFNVDHISDLLQIEPRSSLARSEEAIKKDRNQMIDFFHELIIEEFYLALANIKQKDIEGNIKKPISLSSDLIDQDITTALTHIESWKNYLNKEANKKISSLFDKDVAWQEKHNELLSQIIVNKDITETKEILSIIAKVTTQNLHSRPSYYKSSIVSFEKLTTMLNEKFDHLNQQIKKLKPVDTENIEKTIENIEVLAEKLQEKEKSEEKAFSKINISNFDSLYTIRDVKNSINQSGFLQVAKKYNKPLWFLHELGTKAEKTIELFDKVAVTRLADYQQRAKDSEKIFDRYEDIFADFNLHNDVVKLYEKLRNSYKEKTPIEKIGTELKMEMSSMIKKYTLMSDTMTEPLDEFKVKQFDSLVKFVVKGQMTSFVKEYPEVLKEVIFNDLSANCPEKCQGLSKELQKMIGNQKQMESLVNTPFMF